MTSSLRRRTATIAAALLGATLALAACGSSDDADDAQGGLTEGYPVTVETEYGEITLTEKPEKVVVLGAPALVDVLAALDEPPAVFGWGFSEQEALEFVPWLDGLYEEYADDLIDADFQPIAEAVGVLEPDLIVMGGGGAVLDENQLRQLSDVAPVYFSKHQTDWRAPITELGALTGSTDRAQQVIEDVGAEFAAGRDRLPGLQGKTFFAGRLAPDGTIYPNSYTPAFLVDLGLVPADNQPTAPDPGTPISAENLDQVSADVVLFSGEIDRTKLESDPRYADLPAVKNGSMIFLQETIGTIPLSNYGPHSIPWFFERILPALESTPLNSGE